MNRIRLSCAIAFLSLCVFRLPAQDATPTPTPTPGSTPTASPGANGGQSRSAIINLGGNPSPVPYTASEFPAWAKDLRRFEIVSIGSFPWTFFYASFCFDMCRFLTGDCVGFSFDKLNAGQNPFTVTQNAGYSLHDSRYYPWPLKNSTSYTTTDDEKYLTLLTSLSAALVVGIVDYAIIKVQDREAARKQAALKAKPTRPSPSPEPSPGMEPSPEPSPEASPSPRTEAP